MCSLCAACHKCFKDHERVFFFMGVKYNQRCSRPPIKQGEPRTSRANTSSQLIKICDRIEQKGAEPNYSCVPSARSVTLEISSCAVHRQRHRHRAVAPVGDFWGGTQNRAENTAKGRHAPRTKYVLYHVRLPSAPSRHVHVYTYSDVVEYLRNPLWLCHGDSRATTRKVSLSQPAR